MMASKLAVIMSPHSLRVGMLLGGGGGGGGVVPAEQLTVAVD